MPLNPSPNATRFLGTMSIATGRKATLGDANSFTDDGVRRVLTELSGRVSASIDVINKLDKDESRTDVSKHDRGRTEATTLNQALAHAQKELRTIADKKVDDASARINDRMKLDPSRAVFQNRKIDFIAKAWSDPNGGSAAITKHIKADLELAAIVANGEGYVLGLPDEQRMKFYETGVKTHMPNEYADMQTAARIRETADKYDDVMQNVSSSFYIEAVADKIATRVE